MKKSHPYMPMAWRWDGVEQAGNKSLVNVIDKEEEFTFRPYVELLEGLLDLVSSPSATKRSLPQRDTMDHLAIAMAIVVAPTLLPSKTKSSEDVALYSPLRVLRQLGYDLGAIMILGDTRNSLPSTAEARFIWDIDDSILARHSKLFWHVVRRVSMSP